MTSSSNIRKKPWRSSSLWTPSGLLERLQFYVRNADQSFCMDFKQLGPVLDLYGTVAAQNAIVRDVMMLENQLPLFLLQKLLELQFERSKENAEKRLHRLLRLICQELSPFTFKLPDDSKLHIDIKRGHLLEVLYYSIVPLSNNHNTNVQLNKKLAMLLIHPACQPLYMKTMRLLHPRCQPFHDLYGTISLSRLAPPVRRT